MEQGRQLVIVTTGGEPGESLLEIGDAGRLARRLRDREFGDYDVLSVYAADGGALVQLDWTTDCGEFDEHLIAVGKVKVCFPDGQIEVGFYTIDGAS